MLDRNKLAKQFELVVQQEIKNHNDSILATNLAINNLGDQIVKLNSDQNFLKASFLSDLTKTNINLNNLSESCKIISQKVSSLIEDGKKINEINEKLHSETASGLEIAFERCLKLEKEMFKHSQMHVKFEDKIKKINLQMLENSENLYSKIKKEMLALKKEILELPSEANIVRVNLLKRIEEREVDIHCLCEEINAVKKTQFIIEKKIENIYTLIERLSKKIGG